MQREALIEEILRAANPSHPGGGPEVYRITAEEIADAILAAQQPEREAVEELVVVARAAQMSLEEVLGRMEALKSREGGMETGV